MVRDIPVKIVSAIMPITRMTIIQAMTSSMWFSCRAKSRLAPTDVTPSASTKSSPAINERQAKAQPWLSPATYDGSAARLHVNGTLVRTLTFSGPMLTSTGVLRIGGNSVWGEFFQGRIDEVRIYNRALTAAEIQTDMTAPLAP